MSQKDSEKDKQMFQFTQPKVEIGTEILDPSLPSNLDFQKKSKEYEGDQVNNPYSKNKQEILMENHGQYIRTFTIKGKKKIQHEPEFLPGTIIKDETIGFQLKAFDQEKSGGWKSLWQGIVGYVKRQLLIKNGYIYLFQKVGDGLMAKSCWKLSQLMKVFVDAEDAKIRLVFRSQDNKLTKKNFQYDKYEEFVHKLQEEVGKAQLMFITE